MLGMYLLLLDTDEEIEKFKAIFDLYEQDMFKTANYILKNPHAAEDAVHEAFLRIIKNFTNISQINCPQTHAYVIIIVKHVAYRMYNESNRIVIDDIDDQYSIKSNTSVEDDTITKVNVELLKKCLTKLPKEYYEIIFLEYSKGLKLNQIADVLNISYENAKKRLQRAKAKLKSLLEKEETFNGL